jgi:monoamine oxidase
VCQRGKPNPVLFLPTPHRLLFAGEATHPKFYSTMHGARSSGLREAERVLHARGPPKHG